MIRASIELAVISFFAAVAIAWCDQGATLVLLNRLGGW